METFHMNSKHIQIQSPVLKEIISTYANLWADVMLSKNLKNHLLKIETDLHYMEQVTGIMEKEGKNTTKLAKVADQLYCLKLIIQKKLKLRA